MYEALKIKQCRWNKA